MCNITQPLESCTSRDLSPKAAGKIREQLMGSKRQQRREYHLPGDAGRAVHVRER